MTLSKDETLLKVFTLIVTAETAGKFPAAGGVGGGGGGWLRRRTGTGVHRQSVTAGSDQVMLTNDALMRSNIVDEMKRCPRCSSQLSLQLLLGSYPVTKASWLGGRSDMLTCLDSQSQQHLIKLC